MLPFEANQRFCVQATLDTGDTSKSLKAAVTGYSICVTRVDLTSITAAAQALYVGDSSGNVKAISVAASFTAHAQAHMESEEGLKLTVSEALIIKPAAAGPSVHVVATGYILKN